MRHIISLKCELNCEIIESSKFLNSTKNDLEVDDATIALGDGERWEEGEKEDGGKRGERWAI